MSWVLRWDEARRLTLVRGDTAVVVQATCCFPWSYPTDYISLRNDKHGEEAFVARLSDLPPQGQAVLQEALRRRNFLPEITHIHNIAEDQELYVWSVSTQAGERKFLTERRDHIRILQGGKVLLRDVANDMLLISDVQALDAKSLALIRAQMD